MTDKDIEKWYERPLKKITSKEMEELIANTISKVTNEKYQVEIKSLDYNPNQTQTPSFDDTTEMTILIKKL